jgi:hypothetical protein
MSRVFYFLYYRVRAHFLVGARTASFPISSLHLCHPNLLSPFPFINSVLPTKHLFDRNSSGVRSAVGAERVKQSGGDGIVPLP